MDRRSCVAIGLAIVPILAGLGCRSRPAPVERAPAPLTPAARPPDLPANARISIARTECMGSCPVYDLEIRGTGQVIFHGVAFVRVRDTVIKQVSREAVARLFADFQDAGYFHWKDLYETAGTDLATVITSVTLGPLQKQITDYGPDALFAQADPVIRIKLAFLEDRVDAVAGSDQWVRCPGEELGHCHTR